MTEKPVRPLCNRLSSQVLLAFLALGVQCSLAQHADILIDVTDGQLTVNEDLFLADFRGGLQADNFLELSSPGYATRQANRLRPDTLLSFDILGPLLSFDGTTWRPAQLGSYFELTWPALEGHSTITTGDSGSQNGFLLAQADAQGMIHQHIRFRLGMQNEDTPAEGVYAIQQVLTSPSYAASDPFLLAFNNGLEPASFIRSVVAARQLIADSVFDCSGDGLLTADDLACVSEVAHRDQVLRAIGSIVGDLDGNGAVDFADFLRLSQNFGTSATSYVSGNIDLADDVGFSDFLILSRNFGFETNSTRATIPEPDGVLVMLLALTSLGPAEVRRRRRTKTGGVVAQK